MKSDREIAIGLLWHSLESGNQGVNALTVSNMAIVRDAAAAAGVVPRLVVFGPGTHPPRRIAPDVEVRTLNRRTMISTGEYRRAIAELDCVIDISAGDSFADIYGAKRFFWMWLSKRLVLAAGKPLVLAPQTIGPFTRQPYRLLAGGVMRRATLTVARDPRSLAAVEARAPGARCMLAADVAFRLPYKSRPGADDGRVHVGVNVSGLLWHESGEGGAHRLSYDYAALMSQVLDALDAREDVTVHLITHVVDRSEAADTDGAVADMLGARYPRAVRVPDFAGPSEAKSYISGLDMLVAARMHACIAAFSSGVPVVPVAYSRKFAGLFGDLLGYPHTLGTEGEGLDSAATFILDRVDRREELARDVAAGNARVTSLLDGYVRALEALFVEIGERRA